MLTEYYSLHQIKSQLSYNHDYSIQMTHCIIKDMSHKKHRQKELRSGLRRTTGRSVYATIFLRLGTSKIASKVIDTIEKKWH